MTGILVGHYGVVHDVAHATDVVELQCAADMEDDVGLPLPRCMGGCADVLQLVRDGHGLSVSAEAAKDFVVDRDIDDVAHRGKFGNLSREPTRFLEGGAERPQLVKNCGKEVSN